MTGPSLTVLIGCHEHADRIQRLVAHVAPYADEVLVAADDRMSEDELALIAGAGPITLLRTPWALPANRPLPFLHDRCAGDWVLRLDGDEAPSLGLLARLRELIGDPRFTHYQLPIAWTWPDARHRLAERPWWPDPQPRLHRNDPALVFVPGVLHVAPTVAGAGRLLDAPAIFHLDLAITSVERRRRKVGRYDDVDASDGRAVFGRPLNHALYLPEDYAPLPQVLEVEAADADALERLIAGPVRPPDAAVRAELVTREAIDAQWTSRPVAGAALAGGVELLERLGALDPHGERELLVAVENAGSERWPGGWMTPEIALAHRWLARGGAEVAAGRSPLPGPVRPGERTGAVARLAVPGPGEYRLEIELVHAGRRFGSAARVAARVG